MPQDERFNKKKQGIGPSDNFVKKFEQKKPKRSIAQPGLNLKRDYVDPNNADPGSYETFRESIYGRMGRGNAPNRRA